MPATILTPAEMAKRLNVSRATLAKWMRLGIVPYSRFSKRTVRFNLERVLKAIDGLETGNDQAHT